MKTRLTLLCVLFLILVTGFVINYKANVTPATTSFEGTIAFTKKVGSSESKYKYHVKGDKIRIEELGADGTTVQGVMIVNTKANTVIALSPERKLYMDIPNNRVITAPSIEVSKKETTKTLMNYTCSEWEVTGKEDDRVITYWMAFDKFDFFNPLLKTLNRKDKQAVYFQYMTGSDGAFPMLGIEKKSDGTEISRLTVTAISRSTIASTQFDIPKGYSKFEK